MGEMTASCPNISERYLKHDEKAKKRTGIEVEKHFLPSLGMNIHCLVSRTETKMSRQGEVDIVV